MVKKRTKKAPKKGTKNKDFLISLNPSSDMFKMDNRLLENVSLSLDASNRLDYIVLAYLISKFNDKKTTGILQISGKELRRLAFGYEGSRIENRALMAKAFYRIHKIILSCDYVGLMATYVLFIACIYEDISDTVYVKINPDVLPFLHDLTSQFCTAKVTHLAKCKSKYSQILYLWLCLHKKTDDFLEIGIDNLRALLGIDKKEYTGKFSDFDNKVLKVIESDLKSIFKFFKYTKIKENKNPRSKVVKILFNFEWSDDLVDLNNLLDRLEKEDDAKTLDELALKLD